MSDKDNNEQQQPSKITEDIFAKTIIQRENKIVQPISLSEKSTNGVTMNLLNFAKNEDEE